ncbi:hypothetical protein RHSIM_Rhsim11G0145400 [Rhododendron simsii]|uniref:BHLH domain-containing protein n=1 Tax=Rhododendron simsii TaxID=118357 RepID=A0A834L9Z9_RHOSS|nr:hypothetical protein RHSIM_Rhsim11G0145400 [Rhododendron simsii]
MEDVGFMRQWPTNSLDEIVNHHFSHQIFDVKPNITEYSSHDTGIINPPGKILKTNTWNSSSNSSSPHQISFSNSNCETQFGTIKPKEEAALSPSSNITTLPSGVYDFQQSFGNQIYGFKARQGSKKNSTNGTRFSSSQEHIMAERKRREKLSQRLIALSAIVPGLKKMDKASVLGDAIKYVKQLQEQVKTLEEQTTRTKSMETVVYVRKCELNSDHNLDNFSSENNFSGGGGSGGGGSQYDETLPEIEARFCDKNVLIRIHCEKRKGVVEKTVAEVEKLHLSIVNSSAITFGSSVLDITINAQMDEDFSLTMKDLVRNLHAALKLFM